MTGDVRWSRKARADFDLIDDYFAALGAELATEIGRRLLAATRFLVSTPKAGPQFGTGSRRKWAVRDAPYVVIYRAHPTHITILRIRHNRANWRPE